MTWPHSFSLLVLAALVGCAEAPDGSNSTIMSYAGADAGRDSSSPPITERDSGFVEPPPYDAGSSVMGPVDSGSPTSTFDAGRPTDAGQATADTGSTTGPVDSGPPRPVDAGFDAGPQPVDAGPRPVDAGTDSGPSTVDAGGNAQMCATTAAYPTTTACARCTCMRCATQVATCYASSDATKNTQCAKVQECAEKNECIDADCYCGGSLFCANPDGPCRTVIETAGGVSTPLDVQRVRDDPNSSLGRAAAIGGCQVNNCRSECGL